MLWDRVEKTGEAAEERLLKHARFIIEHMDVAPDPDVKLAIFWFDEQSWIFKR